MNTITAIPTLTEKVITAFREGGLMGLPNALGKKELTDDLLLHHTDSLEHAAATQTETMEDQLTTYAAVLQKIQEYFAAAARKFGELSAEVDIALGGNLANLLEKHATSQSRTVALRQLHDAFHASAN